MRRQLKVRREKGEIKIHAQLAHWISERQRQCANSEVMFSTVLVVYMAVILDGLR